jgi:shikimate dehydrogenase
MHNALYLKLGLAWEYRAQDCDSIESAQAFLDKGDFLGINITTPYKPLAYQNASVKAASAKLAQGANVLARKGSELLAYNMDGEGCVLALERKGVSFDSARVVVCGSGPTALAIAHAAAMAGAAHISLIGRNKQRSARALQGFLAEYRHLAWATFSFPSPVPGHRGFREAYEETDFNSGSYRSSKQAFSEADIIVNATPLGMSADDPAPFDTALLHEGQVVCDVVYGHGVTELLAQALKLGCAAFDGSSMLVAQAVASARAFFMHAGIDPDISDDEMFAIMAEAADF